MRVDVAAEFEMASTVGLGAGSAEAVVLESTTILGLETGSPGTCQNELNVLCTSLLMQVSPNSSYALQIGTSTIILESIPSLCSLQQVKLPHL